MRISTLYSDEPFFAPVSVLPVTQAAAHTINNPPNVHTLLISHRAALMRISMPIYPISCHKSAEDPLSRSPALHSE